MEIQRDPREAPYAAIPNAALRDPRLSFRARGLLAYLLSLPPGWTTSIDRIAAEAGDAIEGRDALRTAFRELIQAGYGLRTKHQDERGRWHTRCIVYHESRATTPAQPILIPVEDSPVDNSAATDDGFPVVGLTRGNAAKAQVAPTTGKPTTGKPTVGKSGAIKKPDKKKEEPPPNPPPADRTVVADGPTDGGGGGEISAGAQRFVADLPWRRPPSARTRQDLAAHVQTWFTAGWTAATLRNVMTIDRDTSKSPDGVMVWRLHQEPPEPPASRPTQDRWAGAPAWCTHCDPVDRTVEVGGVVSRCGECHPAKVRPA